MLNSEKRGVRVQFALLAPLLAYAFAGIHVLASRHEVNADERARLILVVLSTVCSIPVLAVHWTFPPHPKFMLLKKRKRCVRVHIMAGSIEYAAGIWALMLGSPFCAQVMAAVAILVHVPSASLQAPFVFGARLIMVPSYMLCIALHFYCALRLWIDPSSDYWLVQTFLAFSIYAWVRWFYCAFHRWRLFGDWSYSTAVLFAGLLIAPAVIGPLAFLLLLSFITLYDVLYWFILRPSPDQLLDDFMEHRRGTYASTKLRRAWQRLRQRTSAADETGDESDVESARQVFRLLDADGSGQLDTDEVRRAMREVETEPEFVELFVDYLQHKRIDFNYFRQRIWEFGVRSRLTAIPPSQRANTPDDQARIVFDQLDLDHSGHIGLFELWILLTEWDLPSGDVKACIEKYGDATGEISFATFRDRLRPLWRFAYFDVIAR